MEIETTFLIAYTLGGTLCLPALDLSKLATFQPEDSFIPSSPPLKPIPLKRTPSPEVSFLPTYITSSSDGEDESKSRPRKKRHRRKQYTQGDAVLINYLSDWNRPDLANSALQNPLPPDISSETPVGGESDQEMEVMSTDTHLAPSDHLAQLATSSLRVVSKQGLDSEENGVCPPSRELERTRPTVVTQTNVKAEEKRPEKLGGKPEDGLPASLSPSIGHLTTQDSSLHGSHPSSSQQAQLGPKLKDESMAISQVFQQYAIKASEGSPMETLPALQSSPSLSSRSPTGQQNLPSIQSQLGDLASEGRPLQPSQGQPLPNRQSFPVNGDVQSPPGEFTSPRPPTYPPLQARPNGYPVYPAAEPSPASTNSAVSPREALRPRQHPRSRSPPQKLGPAEYATSGLTPQNEVQTPLSASTQASHASMRTLSTSTERSPVAERINADQDRPMLPPLSAGGPLNGGGFKCDHPGCTAPPFQTQYLLK